MSDHVEITPDPLVHDTIVGRAHDNGAGAIATFIGITRDTFEGKKVAKLEYECYKPMAGNGNSIAHPNTWAPRKSEVKNCLHDVYTLESGSISVS